MAKNNTLAWLGRKLARLSALLGVLLYAAIFTILMARLSESQFLVKINVTDFWGAVVVGFIAQYVGKAALDKYLPGREGERKEGASLMQHEPGETEIQRSKGGARSLPRTVQSVPEVSGQPTPGNDMLKRSENGPPTSTKGGLMRRFTGFFRQPSVPKRYELAALHDEKHHNDENP